MDLSNLGSLAGSLLKAGLPMLGPILGDAAPFAFNLLVRPAFAEIAAALGVNPESPDAAQQVQAQVDANPSDAVAKLQAIEQAQKDAADAANEELRLRLLDVQDARAAEGKLVAANSPMQWGPAVISFVIILGYAICCIVSLPNAAVQAGMYETIKLLAVTVASYWLGSSTGSRAKDDHLAALARAPTVNAQPGSHVSSGVITGRK